MSYNYSLPTTGSLSFVDFLESVGPYSSEISDATAQRARLRAVLKELKKETHSTRDYQIIINVSGLSFFFFLLFTLLFICFLYSRQSKNIYLSLLVSSIAYSQKNSFLKEVLVISKIEKRKERGKKK
jgi:hypothetical protein